MRQAGRHFRGWTWARRATAAAFIALLILGAQEGFAWFRGSTSAATLAQAVTVVDPLAALEVTLSSRRVEPTLVVGALVLIAVCALMGPIFCGWVCPLGLLLDLNGGIRRRLRRFLERRGKRLPEVRLAWAYRYGVLGLFVGFSALASLPAFQTFSPINLLSWSLVFFPQPAPGIGTGLWGALTVAIQTALTAGGWMLLLLGLLVASEYLAPRIWCRSLCPLGALYSLIGRWAPFRVQIKAAKANHSPCFGCSTECPMGIRVTEEFVAANKSRIDHLECTRCGACIDACSRTVFGFGFFSKGRGRSS
jgi:ferredoxin-type protein NapH